MAADRRYRAVAGWTEVGDRVWCRRYDPWDVTVGVVAGEDGVLVVDTRASDEEAAELLEDLRALDRRPPRWVVNTHGHFDHVNGNAVLAPAEVWGHPSLAAVDHAVDHPVGGSATIDLGDRTGYLHHLGPAHTAGDIVVVIAGAGVVFAGDLVEESGPPAYGDDSFPLDWPAAVDRLLELVGDDDAVVPGHGQVVGRGFVAAQQLQLAEAASVIRDLWLAGVPKEAAADAAAPRWPFPPQYLAEAVRAGYRQLR